MEATRTVFVPEGGQLCSIEKHSEVHEISACKIENMNFGQLMKHGESLIAQGHSMFMQDTEHMVRKVPWLSDLPNSSDPNFSKVSFNFGNTTGPHFFGGPS